MKYRDIYDKELCWLSKMIESSSIKLTDIHEDFERNFGYLFDFGQIYYLTYNSIIDANVSRSEIAIENIFVQMLERSNKDFFYYPIAKEFANHPEAYKTRKFQVCIKEKNLNIGYVFRDKDKIIDDFKNGKVDTKIDGLKIVLLQEPVEKAYDVCITIRNKLYENIKYVTLKEVMDECFGEETYCELCQCIKQFNANANKLIGYQTVITPTKDSIDKFKERVVKPKLIDRKYRGIIENSIDSSEMEIIDLNYYNKERYKLLLGDDNFAISFISSEWFYSLDQFSDCLDGTVIVAGYLKSVEQLLYHIISKYIDNGYMIKRKSKNTDIEFSMKNEDDIDTTLCSLEQFISKNGSILDISPKTKNYIINTISKWRKHDRNGNFHKDVIKEKGIVDEIQNDTYLLYYLILGSFSINK